MSEQDDGEVNRAKKCGCQNCQTVGLRMPDSPGKYAFDGVGGVTVCVEDDGSCVVHFDGVEDV